MSENRIEEMVRSAVAQALERQLPSLRESVVQDVLRELGPSLTGTSDHGDSAALQSAISAIQAGTTQKEILRALLDNASIWSGRAALFVIKNGSAVGWNGVGFSNNDDIKDAILAVSSGLGARAMQNRSAEIGNVSDIDPGFIARVGSPHDGTAVILPLLLKEKVSALIYADGGHNGAKLNPSALDVLVRATSSWLEVVSQRKQTHREPGAEPEAMHSLPSNDPFAAHAPMHAASTQHAEPAPVAAMSAAAGWGGATSIPAGEDGEVHRKAQRFARLLMDEIKLYNQAKVDEGRKHRDLYDRLKEDIEKSRTTYQKRYGNTAAAGADYFNQELIRSLAEDDVSLMGSNFRR